MSLDCKLIFLLIIVFCKADNDEIDTLLDNYKCRHSRKCGAMCPHPLPHQECERLRGLLHNSIMLAFSIIMLIILILILLGMIKGLIGLLCCPRIGIMGLNMLIDLPRPLPRYQENDLRHRKVKYDILGWPVHPDTNQRSVRPITKQTEFCLNLVFFLTYPLALILHTCAFCCCIRNYNKEDDDLCFKNVRVIRLIDCSKFKKRGGQGAGSGPEHVVQRAEVYTCEAQEREDTDYVISMLRRSQESLRAQNHSSSPSSSTNYT